MKYTKKPLTIEAVQLLDTPQSIHEVTTFMQGKLYTSARIASEKWEDYLHYVSKQGGIYIKTLESDGQTQKADFGDYIIKGVKGEFYPCKPDIFNLMYDPA